MLKTGLIGLPNVGKSSLFKLITKAEVNIANYPFATIKPTEKIVEVKDDILDKLSSGNNSKKTIYSNISFIDIAGLIKNSSKGEGLGNDFIESIRNVDQVLHVVRCFSDPEIIHVNGSADPIRDIKTIELELLLSDHKIITSSLLGLEKNIKKLRINKSLVTNLEEERNLLMRIEKSITENLSFDFKSLTEQERNTLKKYRLISLKPVFFILNVADSKDLQISLPETKSYIKEQDNDYFEISCNNFEDISIVNELIKAVYKNLQLQTFYTIGEKEARAWTFKKGSNMKTCASIIHTDISQGFIAAEIISYEKYSKDFNIEKIRKQRGFQIFKKDSIMQDKDIAIFRFNIKK